MNLDQLRDRVYDLAEEAKKTVDVEVAMLLIVGRLAETAEHLYEQAARLDRELRACRQLLDDAKAAQVPA